VAAILFLGGWHTGIGPLDEALLLLKSQGAAAEGFNVAGYLANLIGMVVILSKGSLLVCVQIWVRWTLPRLRIDQVMTTCLKYLIPISCFLFLGAVLWPIVMVWLTGRSHWLEPMGEKLRPAAVGSLQTTSGFKKRFHLGGRGWSFAKPRKLQHRGFPSVQPRPPQKGFETASSTPSSDVGSSILAERSRQ